MRCPGVRCRVSAGTFQIRMTRIVVRCRFAELLVFPIEKTVLSGYDGGRRHRWLRLFLAISCGHRLPQREIFDREVQPVPHRKCRFECAAMVSQAKVWVLPISYVFLKKF